MKQVRIITEVFNEDIFNTILDNHFHGALYDTTYDNGLIFIELTLSDRNSLSDIKTYLNIDSNNVFEY